MTKKLLIALLLAGSSLLAAPRIAIGVGIGIPVGPAYVAPAYVAPAYVPPPAYYAPAPVYAGPAFVPPAPGPGYFWTAGYWYVAGGRRIWRPGYWAPRSGFHVRGVWRR